MGKRRGRGILGWLLGGGEPKVNMGAGIRKTKTQLKRDRSKAAREWERLTGTPATAIRKMRPWL